MKNEIKLNTIIFISLIGLILASFFIAEAKISNFSLSVVAISTVKFIAVLFQFVELKNAHLVWKLLGFLFILSFILVLIIYI
jgi:hypothetical protein